MKPKNYQVQFMCPSHGMVERDDVEFWCNHCQREELVLKDGMYLCPTCLLTDNKEKKFTCARCGREVKMIETKGKKISLRRSRLTKKMK